MKNDAIDVDRSLQRYLALSRWENEGGAAVDISVSGPDATQPDVLPLSSTE